MSPAAIYWCKKRWKKQVPYQLIVYLQIWPSLIFPYFDAFSSLLSLYHIRILNFFKLAFGYQRCLNTLFICLVWNPCCIQFLKKLVKPKVITKKLLSNKTISLNMHSDIFVANTFQNNLMGYIISDSKIISSITPLVQTMSAASGSPSIWRQTDYRY